VKKKKGGKGVCPSCPRLQASPRDGRERGKKSLSGKGNLLGESRDAEKRISLVRRGKNLKSKNSLCGGKGEGPVGEKKKWKP